MSSKTLKTTGSAPAKTSDTRRARYLPKTDIVENTDGFVATIELPGVRKEDVDISFEDGVLSVHAHSEQRHEKDTPYLWREYRVGDFYRSFKVHDDLDPDGITASLADGVLTLNLPKAAEAKPRRILLEPK